nr:MAG TPA: hypothetical protein [Caudoviricetes sp.]
MNDFQQQCHTFTLLVLSNGLLLKPLIVWVLI